MPSDFAKITSKTSSGCISIPDVSRYPAASLTEIRLSQLKLPPLIGLVLVEHGVSQRVLEKSNYRLEKRTTHHGEDVVI